MSVGANEFLKKNNLTLAGLRDVVIVIAVAFNDISTLRLATHRKLRSPRHYTVSSYNIACPFVIIMCTVNGLFYPSLP